jgi:hypothetical protein
MVSNDAPLVVHAEHNAFGNHGTFAETHIVTDGKVFSRC